MHPKIGVGLSQSMVCHGMCYSLYSMLTNWAKHRNGLDFSLGLPSASLHNFGVLQHHFTLLVSTTSPTTVMDTLTTGPPVYRTDAGLKGHGKKSTGADSGKHQGANLLLLKSHERPHMLQCLAAQAAWVSSFLLSFMEMNLQDDFKKLFCNTSLGKKSQVQMAC